MKKFVVLLLGLSIVAFGTTVYAQKIEMNIRGNIDFGAFWFKNIDRVTGPIGGFGSALRLPNGGEVDKSGAYAVSRARLQFDAKAGKDVRGTIIFEIDSSRWGDEAPASGGAGRNSAGFWGADRVAVEVKHFYIDVAIPYFGVPVPMTGRFGVQPLSIRSDVLVYTDGAGITLGMKADPVQITPFWFKAVEGADANSDDSDVYGVRGNYKFNGHTIGGYAMYYNMNTYPLNATTGYGVTPDDSAEMWWLGAYWDGKVGPVICKADLIFDTGKVEGRGTRAALEDIDYRGWLGRVNVKYPWEAFEFGGGILYASGADYDDVTSNGRPGSASINGQPLPDKHSGYVTPPGAETGPDRAMQYGSVVYGSPLLSREPRNTGNSGTQLNATELGGMWNARAYATWKATPWYKVTLQGMYIGDTVDNGDHFGNSIDLATGQREDESDIGWEFTLTNVFQVYKNVRFALVGGYLFAGDAMDQYNSATGRNEDIDNPWIIGTRLYYSF
jgi:hypothetical protein